MRAASLANEMKTHGFASGDAQTDLLVTKRLEAYVLSHVSQIYSRTATGASQPGAWKISFTATAPAGTPGVTHSRIAVGGTAPVQGMAGKAPTDPGNASKEDAVGPGFGIFSGSIDGKRSTLSPALAPADKKFVDGTYVLGSGTADEDARCRKIKVALDDWARAIACVAAHEIGHSVGCSHLDEPFSVMKSQGSPGEWSDPRTGFIGQSVTELDASLGRH
jgi:hypothetical protein